MAIYNGGLNIVNISASTSGSGNAITSLSADGNVITATRGATFLTSLPDHSHNYAGSSTAGGDANSSKALTAGNKLEGSAAMDDFIEAGKLKYATFGGYGGVGFDGEDGLIISIPWSSDQYGAQMIFDDAVNAKVKIRTRSKSSWGSWKQMWIEGDRITGAVFNDLVDAIPVGEGDILEAGYCYGFDGEHYTKTSEYMQKSYIGIHSDTYGFKMGHEKGKEKLNVAISGFVLAYVDKEYEVGTPLTCTVDGCLTEIKLEDKIKYPERVIATYWKSESNEEWGPEGDKIKVNGRKWVKVK